MMTKRVVVAAVMALVVSSAAGAAQDVLWLRLFLTDGASLVSYGEYARVDDRVIFSMVVGGTADQPRLHPVTVPARAIDWPRTERHAASARYQRYAQTRGEGDFLRLNNDVAAVLNEVLLTRDRARALAIAEQARATLVDWPREHYGYRQKDVQEIVAVVDEAISGLRAAAGVTSFDVTLVALAPPVELERLAAMPSPRDQLDQLFRVAELTERAADRVALLESALALLSEVGASLPAVDAVALRRRADSQIREERAIDARYDQLAQRLVTQATQAAARARVGDVERVLARIPREDARLGRRRPEMVLALHASVQGQLDAARHLRLLRDQWTLRRSLYFEYQRSVGSQLLQLVKSEPLLEAIRRLDGPAPDALVSLRARLAGGAERLERVRTPADLQVVHDLLIGAWRFAENAVSARYRAVQAADVTTAWEASSSAAGALLLLARVQQEIRTLLEPPRLP
ncbi:MAG: hypothetical protein HY657_12395 [Acidobacteria bacterium]|nr:hypothetical protein [Acidobacteriota bacterium]